MAARAPSGLTRRRGGGEIDRKRKPAIDACRAIHQPNLVVQTSELCIGELRRSVPQPQLI